jgi:hypothetical protein
MNTKNPWNKTGFVVVELDGDDTTAITNFLQTHHAHMHELLYRAPPTTHEVNNNNYTTMFEMNTRAKWVTKLGKARKALKTHSLGEKRMRLLLDEFPTELAFQSGFHTECSRNVALFVDRLVALNPDARKGLSRKVAQSLCFSLIGVSPAEIEAAEAPAASTTTNGNPKKRTRNKKATVTMVTPHSKNDDDNNDGETSYSALSTDARNSSARRRLVVDG